MFQCLAQTGRLEVRVPTAWVKKCGSCAADGFHGISCAVVCEPCRGAPGTSRRFAETCGCHLGGGASVTATAGGLSVDTTMGFIPTEGLVMATRPGDVDPGSIVRVEPMALPPESLPMPSNNAAVSLRSRAA